MSTAANGTTNSIFIQHEKAEITQACQNIHISMNFAELAFTAGLQSYGFMELYNEVFVYFGHRLHTVHANEVVNHSA